MVQPKILPLINRRVDFTFDKVQSVWLADTIKTQFMQALSLFIPTSERMVIAILRKHQNKVNNTDIQRLITDLIKQEGQHAAMHRRANSAILQNHPELKWVMIMQNKLMGFIQKVSSDGFLLSIPVAFEHFTAAISKDVLTHKDYWISEKSDNNAAIDFLLWHCLEELEHQGACHVIYQDTYKHSFKNNIRIILSLFLFWLPVTIFSVFSVQLYLLIKDKTLLKPKNWLPCITFITRSSLLFLNGVFKYRKKDQLTWDKQEMALYQSACHAFNQRQVDSQ
ncbi:MAG: metal-dependent hydrolase [Bermanella sp.]